jgi:hypothetical protein
VKRVWASSVWRQVLRGRRVPERDVVTGWRVKWNGQEAHWEKREGKGTFGRPRNRWRVCVMRNVLGRSDDGG